MMTRDCRELLDELITVATADIDKLKEEYSGKELNNEQIKDMKWSGIAIMTEAYLASISNSLAVIADSIVDEKGEKLNEETDRD